MSENNDDTLIFGGNIELSGFKSLDSGSMFILKKIVGTNVRKLSNKITNLQKVTLTMKQVHGSGFEINAKLVDDGKVYNSEVSDRNVFFAVDKAFEKLDASLKK